VGDVTGVEEKAQNARLVEVLSVLPARGRSGDQHPMLDLPPLAQSPAVETLHR